MALVVELEQGRRVRVFVLQVQVVHFRLVRRVAALLAHIHLRAPLLVRVLVLHAVHLQAVRLQRTPLRERLLAQIALVRPHSGVGSGVPLKVERVIESLAAERAQVALDVRVALHVPVKEPLQRERLLAYPAAELAGIGTGAGTRTGAASVFVHVVILLLLGLLVLLLLGLLLLLVLLVLLLLLLVRHQFAVVLVLAVPQPSGDVFHRQRVLDAVATVHKLELDLGGKTEILDG